MSDYEINLHDGEQLSGRWLRHPAMTAQSISAMRTMYQDMLERKSPSVMYWLLGEDIGEFRELCDDLRIERYRHKRDRRASEWVDFGGDAGFVDAEQD